MTYNFDADRWYESQKAVLAARRERGELDRRYEEMLARLDGSFRLPD